MLIRMTALQAPDMTSLEGMVRETGYSQIFGSRWLPYLDAKEKYSLSLTHALVDGQNMFISPLDYIDQARCNGACILCSAGSRTLLLLPWQNFG